jgi:hypothetical protein
VHCFATIGLHISQLSSSCLVELELQHHCCVPKFLKLITLETVCAGQNLFDTWGTHSIFLFLMVFVVAPEEFS